MSEEVTWTSEPVGDEAFVVFPDGTPNEEQAILTVAAVAYKLTRERVSTGVPMVQFSLPRPHFEISVAAARAWAENILTACDAAERATGGDRD